MEDKSNNERLVHYIENYIKNKDRTDNDELEVVFGNQYEPITRIDFENVIAKIKSLGFTSLNESGDYHLNVQNQYVDQKTGRTNISNIRTTIEGLKNIQQYCKTDHIVDDLNEKVSDNIKFMQKRIKTVDDVRYTPISYKDHGFRVNYKDEQMLNPQYGMVRDLINTWSDKKKIFRLLKRFTYSSPKYPLKIDLSVIRSSKVNRGRMIPEFRIESSNVLHNPETYEIEIEVDKSRIPSLLGMSKDTVDGLNKMLEESLKQTIKVILSGLQMSNYPISKLEMATVLNDYMNILYRNPPERRVQTRDFVGPSSISLELTNIVPIEKVTKLANIRNPYTITEKADGLRKLLFINKKGKIYLIDTNMKVQFTGVITKKNIYFNTIIDGEHVLHNKTGKFINYYLAFDIYYINKDDVRSEAFYRNDNEDVDGRLIKLTELINNAELKSVSSGTPPLKIRVKDFHYSDQDTDNVFENCRTILERVDEGHYEYHTDGLIFTPANTGVGSDKTGDILPPVKRTWPLSFKWKPAEQNSIDFLVTTVKNESNKDVVKNVFESGADFTKSNNVKQYKTLQLRVGYSSRDGYLNPAEDVIQDNIPKNSPEENSRDYKPVLFYPTNPTPPFPAYLCNIMLQENGSQSILTTENGTEVIEDETIVEFRYDNSREKFWQWVPIKVRYDKTADYKRGGRNYGNSYNTAQSVWNSIHYPVTKEMITTGKDIPDLFNESDIYYVKSDNTETFTKNMRDFHNLYVKKKLITGTTQKKNILIDMSVGKGGDFPKWISSKLDFVFGIDVARDNIENRLNGAYARYLNYRKTMKYMPYALFVNGDSGLNIKSGEAANTEKGKEIIRAIFGDGPKDSERLGKGVFRQYGVGKDGFDVVSNQFSIHYFFENSNTLNEFLRNVSECCKVGGYFIGTCYDGKKVFKLLEEKKSGESVIINSNKGKKIWEIRKQYNSKTFANDFTSLGYKIDVYQESINKLIPEYLVNFDYLTRLLDNYGFTVLSKKEALEMDFPSSVGSFEELFVKMNSELKSRRIYYKNIGNSSKMTSIEKRISFLNTYFIFKKVRDVNAEAISRTLKNELPQEEQGEEKIVLKQPQKPKVIKKGKIKIKKKKQERALEDIEHSEEKKNQESQEKDPSKKDAVVLETATAPGEVEPNKQQIKKIKKPKIRIKKPTIKKPE